MPDEADEYRSCAVCGRTILRGESTSDYVTPEGMQATVCELCKPRAEASGWVPTSLAGVSAGGGRSRRRRGLGLRERLARVSDAVTTARPDEAERAGANGAGEYRPRPRPAGTPRRARGGGGEDDAGQRPAPPPARPRPTREQMVHQALETFNGSEERRKVAGLVRSLGAPSVSVLAEGASAARITVAWELSWYQWRVSEGAIEEVAKGVELDELDERHQAWNAEAAEDGALRLRPASRLGGREEG